MLLTLHGAGAAADTAGALLLQSVDGALLTSAGEDLPLLLQTALLVPVQTCARTTAVSPAGYYPIFQLLPYALMSPIFLFPKT